MEAWASPYLAFNTTRYTDAASWIESPTLFAYTLARMLTVWAPSLDYFAPQDSMGHLGNSYQNVSDFMKATEASLVAGEPPLRMNVELFETWPPECQWPDSCPGRHPAPWDRIVKQMANECNKPWKCLAWEWTSCLSPNGETTAWRNETKANYEAYKEYLGGGAAGRGGVRPRF